MQSSTTSLTIDPRFQGPPQSGNGGYVGGLLARHMGRSAIVRLHAPPPLARELSVDRSDAVVTRLLDGERLLAEARPGEPDATAPPAPSFAAAEEASRRYLGFEHHPLPGCFVCGTDRVAGDGMRIFAGPLAGGDLVAAPWIPDATLRDTTSGAVAPEFVWAALDCPGVFAFRPDNDRFMLLGTLAARVETPIDVAERCVVVAWPMGGDGRKHFAGSAIFGAGGALCAIARATWIEIDAPAL